mgnify:CR=1 FL=1
MINFDALRARLVAHHFLSAAFYCFLLFDYEFTEAFDRSCSCCCHYSDRFCLRVTVASAFICRTVYPGIYLCELGLVAIALSNSRSQILSVTGRFLRRRNYHCVFALLAGERYSWAAVKMHRARTSTIHFLSLSSGGQTLQ